jgi:hypothetical protein
MVGTMKVQEMPVLGDKAERLFGVELRHATTVLPLKRACASCEGRIVIKRPRIEMTPVARNAYPGTSGLVTPGCG